MTNLDSKALAEVGDGYPGRHCPRFLGSRFRCRISLSLVVVSVHLRSIVFLAWTLVGLFVGFAKLVEAIIKSIKVSRLVLRAPFRRWEGALEIPPRLTRLRDPLKTNLTFSGVQGWGKRCLFGELTRREEGDIGVGQQRWEVAEVLEAVEMDVTSIVIRVEDLVLRVEELGDAHSHLSRSYGPVHRASVEPAPSAFEPARMAVAREWGLLLYSEHEQAAFSDGVEDILVELMSSKSRFRFELYATVGREDTVGSGVPHR